MLTKMLIMKWTEILALNCIYVGDYVDSDVDDITVCDNNEEV